MFDRYGTQNHDDGLGRNASANNTFSLRSGFAARCARLRKIRMLAPPPESPDLLGFTRRPFFTLATVTLAAVGGLVLSVPLLGALLGSA